ncbi:molybdopterin-dependent oxidoreductase [Chloroflexota bacterium]
MDKKGLEVFRTTTWSAGPGCHGNCGVLAYVREGRVVKVEGDPDHPWNQGRLCPRCLAMTQYMYHPDRLRQPLKRVGERGEGKWEVISWEEAFDFIENKMKDIRDRYGAESIIFQQGTGRDIGGWISMLAYAYGSPNWIFGLSGVACYTPRLMTMWVTHGDHCVMDAAQWLTDRYENPVYKVPECTVVWGQSLGSTCPDGFFSHWIVDLMKRGSELIVIDPRFTWLASRSKHWLQLRPGTDGALALGFLNVIISEGLYDKDFVQKWTNAPFLVWVDGEKGRLLRENDVRQNGVPGNFVVWDTNSESPAIWNSERAEYSNGSIIPASEGVYRVKLVNGNTAECKTVWTLLEESVGQYTAERVSEITWVPAEKIVSAARFYAKSRPSAVHWGLPIDTIASTTPTSQAVTHLWCLTGNLDVPGGNVIARYPFDVTTYPFHSGVGILDLPPEITKKRIGTWKYGAFRDFRAWAQPDMVLEQIFSEDPYPVKGMWIQTSNPIANTGLDPKKWYEALKKLEFVAVVDLFMTPTAMLADIVLPAASFLEKNSLKGWWVPLQAIQKVTTVEDCRSDIEINFELAKRFRQGMPWNTVEELYDHLLKPSGLTYAQLCEKVWMIPPAGHSTAPYLRYEKGLLRKDGRPGFLTPSGKIELYSSWLEYWGLNPLPYYEEPPFSPVSTPDLYKEYPLILTTGARSPAYFHSEHRQIPWLREIDPEPNIEINPETAHELGVKEGDMVYVENWLGRCRRKVKTTPIIHPKVVMVSAGWWFPEKQGTDPSLFGVWDVNVNQLIPMSYNGESGYGCPLKSILCRVYKTEVSHV